MAVVTGHRATIVAALDDPVWAIHRPAVTAWLRSGVPSAGEVAAFVAEASWHTRRHVYRQLRRFRHLAVADELIDAVWERFGDEEAASLLTACSAAAGDAGAPRAGLRGGQLVPAGAGASRGGAERRRVAAGRSARAGSCPVVGTVRGGRAHSRVRISAARAGLAGALRPRGASARRPGPLRGARGGQHCARGQAAGRARPGTVAGDGETAPVSAAASGQSGHGGSGPRRAAAADAGKRPGGAAESHTAGTARGAV